MLCRTRTNFALDVIIFAALVITAVTGVVLWVALPEGRGSSYALFLGLTRRTWADVHDWCGAIMIGGALLHMALHWKWIKSVAARFFARTARQARLNFGMDAVQLVAFALAGVSGLVAWLVLPDSGFRGGRNPVYNATWLGLTRHTWNDVHLYAGLALLAILVAHIALHWKWIAHQLKSALEQLPRPAARRMV